MRILELRQSLRCGNLERLIVSTAAALRFRDMAVEILLLYNRSRARLLGEDEATLPQVHPLIAEAQRQGVPAWQEYDDGPLSVQMVLRTLREIQRRKYDVLHTHDVKADALGVLAGRLMGIPVVATAHGYPRSIRRNDVYRCLDLRVLLLCRQVICVSSGLRQELLAAGLDAERITVVHNGISASDVLSRSTASPHTLREDLGLRPDDTVIMAVGRLSTEKGHTYLLRACRLAAAERPQLRLVVVGDGPLRAALACEARALGIADRVFFLGFRCDAPALIAQCDMLVNPSLGEALGNALLEAMSLGKPVIGTATGGTPEVIVNGETGLIVPAADPEVLADAMVSMIDNPAQACKLGEKGQARALSHFTVERMVEGLAAVFIACTENKRA